MMKFLQVSYALSAIASLVPGTLGNSPKNKLVSTNRGNGQDIIVEYLSTDSSGVVQAETSQLPPSYRLPTGAVSFADMDGDGHLDILRGGMNGRVWLAYNDGSDNFPANIELSTGNKDYYSVHGVDIDNDGDLDFLAMGRGAWSWLNNGDGTFAQGTQLTADNQRTIYDCAVADFNGDGFVDFIIGHEQFYKAKVYLNDGLGGFPWNGSYELAADSHLSRAISTCDFDQDGNMDIAVSHHVNQNSRVYMNDGLGNFTAVDLPSTLTTDSRKNACADLNGDGYPDVVMTDSDRHQVFLNDGAGNFPTMAPLHSSHVGGRIVALGDFDGDGHVDVFVRTVIFLNKGDGTFGNPSGIHGGLDDPYASAFMYSEPSSESPTSSPSSNPTTGSPSKTPTGSPTNGPTGSPTEGPTSAAAAGGATGGALGAASGTGASPSLSGAASPSSSAADSLYYPDWTKSNGGCKTGGGQPQYMTLAPSTWMFATLDACCSRYYGWMLNDCKGTSGTALSGLWYPDWEGSDDSCKNDGSEPEYMASNPGSWMHSSKELCCKANFGWMLNECLGSFASSPNKWFMDWDTSKCKQNCVVGTGPSCGGRAESWDELFDTRSACCTKKASWNPIDCLVD